MFFYREIKKCLRLLLLHRLRSFLSTLGVLFGVVAVIAMLSIGEGAKQETLEQIEQLGMSHIIIRQHALFEEQRSDEQHTQVLEHKSKTLNKRDTEALRQNIPGLLHVAPLKVVEAPLNRASPHFSPEILAVDRSFGEMKDLQMSEGRFLCDLDQSDRRLVCVLGYEVARNLGREGHVGQSLRLGNRHYEIVGVLGSIHWRASKNQSITTRNLDKVIFIPIGVKNQMNGLPHSNDELSEIILHVQDSQSINNTAILAKKILGDLHGGDDHYQIIIPQELLQQADRTQQTFNLILGSIAGISLLVGGIGIMNIMLANVSERTREIGIRRAVGASKRHILIQFLLETLLLTAVGAFLGIVIGIGFSMTISFVAGWRTVVTFWSILLALVMSVGVGLCSGLYPAYQAANMDPIKALRHD